MGIPVRYNLRNLVERKATTLMTAAGIGLTVAVLVTAVALISGLNATFAQTGSPLQVIVLRTGGNAELSSWVGENAYQQIRLMDGVAQDKDGTPLASPESVTVINLPSVDNPHGMNVTVRGLLPVGLQMRQNVRVVEGRMFEPGQREVVVGDSIMRRYPVAHLGGSLRFGRGEWKVVGVFATSGLSAINSEMWCDLNQLRSDFDRQGSSSSVLVRMRDRAAAARIIPAIKADKRLNAEAMREQDYYAQMTKSGAPLMALGVSVAIIMAIGSAFGAMNTMYAAVSRRTREIATLRAVGFSRLSILRSFLAESVFLALLGGAIGCLVALPLNSVTTGIGNFATFSEVAFSFRVGPLAVGVGLAFAAVIGAAGGLLPAWSASRKNVVLAMREA